MTHCKEIVYMIYRYICDLLFHLQKHLTDEVKATRRRKKIDPNENALRNIEDRDDAAASLTR